MKKYGKIIITILLVASIFLLYTYELFNDEPFDDMRAGTVVSARIVNKDGYTNIENLGGLLDILDDIELHRRAYIADPAGQNGSVTIELELSSGKTTTITADNTHIKINNSTFVSERGENTELIRKFS